MKTITLILAVLSTIVFLCFYPDIAWRVYQLIWVVLGLAVITNVYMLIFFMFEDKKQKHINQSPVEDTLIDKHIEIFKKIEDVLESDDSQNAMAARQELTETIERLQAVVVSKT